jgi:hypothetical protein
MAFEVEVSLFLFQKCDEVVGRQARASVHMYAYKLQVRFTSSIDIYTTMLATSGGDNDHYPRTVTSERTAAWVFGSKTRPEMRHPPLARRSDPAHISWRHPRFAVWHTNH